jgi:hypothetical protein
MTQLLAIGGSLRPPALRRQAEWSLAEEARVLRLDTDTGTAKPCLSHRTPRELCPPEATFSSPFKGGSWHGGQLLLCAQTEVVTADPVSGKRLHSWSHPWLNDAHHAAVFDGRLHVVSTGLDALLVVDPASGEVTAIDALEEDVWSRFDPQVDWRRVASTKPHRAHPNCVFRTRHGLWITRFEQRDAICVDDPGRRIDIGAGIPHDGHVWDGRVWFTTVNGHVVVADEATGRVLVDHDLGQIERCHDPLGWCRGIVLVGGVAYVAFSRLRATRWRENLAWLTRESLPRPTRIAAYDLERGVRLAEWNLEPHGVHVVFSLLAG